MTDADIARNEASGLTESQKLVLLILICANGGTATKEAHMLLRFWHTQSLLNNADLVRRFSTDFLQLVEDAGLEPAALRPEYVHDLALTLDGNDANTRTAFVNFCRKYRDTLTNLIQRGGESSFLSAAGILPQYKTLAQYLNTED